MFDREIMVRVVDVDRRFIDVAFSNVFQTHTRRGIITTNLLFRILLEIIFESLIDCTTTGVVFFAAGADLWQDGGAETVFR